MNKTIKSLTAATLVLAFGGLSSFARTVYVNFPEDGRRGTSYHAEYKPGQEHKAPANNSKNNEKRPEKKSEFVELTGKINVTGKNDNKTVTLTTSNGKVYTLTTPLDYPMPTENFKLPDPKKQEKQEVNRPGNNGSDSVKTYERHENSDKNRRPDFDNEKFRQNKKNSVSMESLKNKKGHTIVVKGILNKESSVITVFEINE